MELKVLLREYRLARDSDLTTICRLAHHNDPNQVMVRNMFFDELYSLRKVARGPFSHVFEDGCQVLVGHDRSTGKETRLRITGEVVELRYPPSPEWVAPAAGGIRLYIPIHAK